MSTSNNTVVITGATRGIGLEDQGVTLEGGLTLHVD